MTKKYLDELAYEVIGAAMEVRNILGPGLLESVYQESLMIELNLRGIKAKQEIILPIKYKGVSLTNRSHLKIDLLVEEILVIENKAVEIMHPIYSAQLLSYLQLSELPKGLLINFNSQRIKDDLISMVTRKYAELPDK